MPTIFKFTTVTSHIHYNSILYFQQFGMGHSGKDYIEKKMISDIKNLYQNLVATQTRYNLLKKDLEMIFVN